MHLVVHVHILIHLAVFVFGLARLALLHLLLLIEVPLRITLRRRGLGGLDPALLHRLLTMHGLCLPGLGLLRPGFLRMGLRRLGLRRLGLLGLGLLRRICLLLELRAGLAVLLPQR